MNAPNPTRRTKITASTIRSIKATDYEWFIRDTEQRGFQIKVSPSGNAVYQVEARLGGTGKVKKFKFANVGDISLEDAREKAREALAKIRSGTNPLQEKRSQIHEGITLRELIQIYFKARNLKPRTKQDYQYLSEKFFKPWLDRRVREISKHEIMTWYANGKNAQVETERAYRFLSALMVFATSIEAIIQNPCYLVTNAGIRYRIKARTSHIDVNTGLAKFLKAFLEFPYPRDSEKVARDVILLILTTGLRSAEARTLQWKNVDWERKTITLPDTKNGRKHEIPMTTLTYAMLRYRQENKENSKYVFRIKRTSKSGCITDFQKTLTNICETAHVPVVTPHDLRRTFATVLSSHGVGLADIKLLMNHSTRDVTMQVYIQPDLEKLRGILEQVVRYYDLKIPAFSTNQGCSRYATGTIRYTLYRRGMPTPVELEDPTEEDPEWIAQAEREHWEG